MSSIEDLKKQARNHERKEEWAKALDQYKLAIKLLAQEEQPDIGLYNRVGDIQVRQGQIADAVVNYEQSIALYVEAELPNNAIAVCKKIIRNMPMSHTVYLLMGQIRGKQGLLADARQNFLTYAERMQGDGDIDEGLRALTELADLAPEDMEIRLAVAGQMHGHGRTDDAVAQLQTGYQLAHVKGLDTDPLEKKLRELGVEPELSAATSPSEDGEVEGELEVIEVGDEREQEEIGVEDSGDDEVGEEPPMLGGDDEEDMGEPLPMLEMSDEPELQASSVGGSDSDDRETSEYVADPAEPAELETPAAPEPADGTAPREAAMEDARAEKLAADDVEPARQSSPDPMGHEMLAAMGDVPGAMKSLRTLIGIRPDDLALRQSLVGYARQLKDESALVPTLLELAEAFERTGHSSKAHPVYEHVLSVDPQNARARAGLGQAPETADEPEGEVASSEDYVDLGSLLLDDDQEEKTTRFVVAFEEPSGDEQADFAKMLSQFKSQVADSLGADDVQAHHDLGTAYKEMGLVDEAISEFQQALRAVPDHLGSYELLGQCFIDKGEPEAAVRTLTKSLDLPFEIEDELMGIYYYLGRAHEQLGNKPQAVEFYDRVFSLDINFVDVTERLRALR